MHKIPREMGETPVTKIGHPLKHFRMDSMPKRIVKSKSCKRTGSCHANLVGSTGLLGVARSS
jgi:hypothetical protein